MLSFVRDARLFIGCLKWNNKGAKLAFHKREFQISALTEKTLYNVDEIEKQVMYTLF